MKGVTRLRKGDFNHMDVQCLPDGTQIITISGGKNNETHRLHVKDLGDSKYKIYSDEKIK